MKRVSSYKKKLDKTELKRQKLLDSIEDSKTRVIARALVKSKKDTAKYIRSLRADLRASPFVIIDTGYAPMIETCLKIPRLSTLIISHMGPHELYIMSRVSSLFKIVTTSVFLDLAPAYLDSYANEIADQTTLSQFKFDRKNLCALIEAYKKKIVSSVSNILVPRYPPPIEDLFALWFRTQRKYRQTCKSDAVIPAKADVDYIFVYDTVKGQFLRLRDLDLYQSSKLIEIGEKFKTEWLTEKKNVPFPEKEPMLSLFRRKHLKDMAFSRVKGDFELRYAFIFEGGHIKELTKGDRYQLHYCGSAKVTPFHSKHIVRRVAPFFDYYEQRLIYERKKNPVPFYGFAEPVTTHRLRLMALCTI